MDVILNAANVMDRLARRVGKLAGWLMMPLIFVIVFDVVTRKIDATRLYFSDFSIEYGYSVSTILQDLQWHFHGALMMLVFGFGYLANAHVRVDIFREMLPRRRQAWLEFIGLLILAVPFLVLMIAYSWNLVSLSYSQGEGSESLTGIPQRWIIKSFVIIGFVFAMMSVLATLGRLWVFLKGTPDEQDRALAGLAIFTDVQSELDKAREAAERALRDEEEARKRADNGG
ncbi:MAG: TRAP transporter small permease subunit [Pseudomonadota bacterium]